MVYTFGDWGMGDSDRRTSDYAPAAHHLNGTKRYAATLCEDQDYDFNHDDLLESEFHGPDNDVDKRKDYASDHDEMLHEGFGRETEDSVDGDRCAALSEEGYGSHLEENFLSGSAPTAQSSAVSLVPPDGEVDLHPLNNQVTKKVISK
jgi:hypothetical protein